MLKQFVLQLKARHGNALREQKGQSLIIFVFAILGLIAMMGLALDLGLVYIERVRVSRTTDAAALAAVVELPFEEEAMRRAVEFIELNGYTQQDTEIRVRGCITEFDSGILGNVGEGLGNAPDREPYPDDEIVDIEPGSMTDGYVYRPSIESPPRATFVIDTLAYQPVDRDAGGLVTTQNQANCSNSGGAPLYGTANKLRVSGQVNVNMNFMQFFGFGEVPVSDEAVGENVTNLDVAVVFDVSGSMNFETNCFGCWSEVADRNDEVQDVLDYPFPSNGDFNPLTYKPGGTTILPYWGGDSDPPANEGDPDFAGHDICGLAPAPLESGGYKYSVHEAEFYSQDDPIHGWEFEKRSPGQGFWVIQRRNVGSNGTYIRSHSFVTYSQNDLDNFPQLQGGTYNIECFNGPNLSGECWKNRATTLGEPAPSTPPHVQYDFRVNWANDPTASKRNTHIWIRAAGGSTWSRKWEGRGAVELNDWRKTIYWQVDNLDVAGGPFNNLQDMGSERVNLTNSKWRWLQIAQDLTLADGPHVLKLYQGSTGFNVDKIIITNNPTDSVGDTRTDFFVDGSTGPAATPGSATREACNMCNPTYGRTVEPNQCTCKSNPSDTGGTTYGGGGTGFGCTAVLTTTNQLENDLFHDIDPLRSAQEAVKNFANRLDPKFDQIGFVTFSSSVGERTKLHCLRYAGAGHAGIGGTAKCFDPAVSGGPITYTQILYGIESTSPEGATNIPQGLKEGLEELGIDTPYNTDDVTSSCDNISDSGNACDRRGAARRVLVLMTDGSPNTNTGASCPSTFIWRGVYGGGGSNNAYDCSMYYASQAADNNVVVYTIGIGAGVNRELLEAIATGTDPNPAPGDDGFYFEGKGGKYFPAVKPSDLDAIFEEILNNIFVRIVG